MARDNSSCYNPELVPTPLINRYIRAISINLCAFFWNWSLSSFLPFLVYLKYLFKHWRWICILLCGHGGRQTLVHPNYIICYTPNLGDYFKHADIINLMSDSTLELEAICRDWNTLTCPLDTEIWKRCGISLTLVGRRDLPDTKRRNRTLSSTVNDSNVCHSHCTTESSWLVPSRYLHTEQNMKSHNYEQ